MTQERVDRHEREGNERRRRQSSALIGIVVACVIAVSCGRDAPQPPTVTPPQAAETLHGTERIGWDQRAADPSELAGLRYAMYVDGVRAELTGVTCATQATAAGYACSAPLPTLTRGTHLLEIAAFVQDGTLLESPRSAALSVVMTALVTSAGAAESTASPTAPAQATNQPASTEPLRVIADGLDRPADLATLPDGRVLVAEHTGRIRIVRDGALLEPAALMLHNRDGSPVPVLALAVDPEFGRTHFVYAIAAPRDARGRLTVALARFREVGNTLGDRVPLLDDIPSSADPHASLRFGPDRKLYAAFDDGGDGAAPVSAANWNGKLLRLNADGTTPDDAPRLSPVVQDGFRSPRGLAWDLRAKRLWTADRERVGSIPQSSPPLALAIAEDVIYVGTATGLLRARIDPRNPDRLIETAGVVHGAAVRALAVRDDSSVLVATDSSLSTLAAPPSKDR